MRLTCPSTLPELHGRVSPPVTASWSARRPGDEGLERGLAGGGGGRHPLLEVAAAVGGHERGEGADVRGDGG